MKRLGSIATTLVIIIGIIAIIAYAKMDLICSHILTDQFKTKVTIEDISLSPMENIEVQNVKIMNPPQYKPHSALRIGQIQINAPYLNYLDKISQIKKILISDLVFTVDSVGNVTNWETLMNNLDSGKPSSESSKSSDSYMVINELTFINLKIRIQGKNGDYKEKTIAKLTLKNVKTKEGELVKRLTQAIIIQLIFNIQNLIDIPLKSTENLLNAPIDSSLDKLKSLNPFK
jgi:hypothetical protein